MAAQQKFRVSDKAPQGLFLRSQPVIKDTTRKALLPMGHLVTKKAAASVPNWWEVSTTLEGPAWMALLTALSQLQTQPV